MHSSAPGAAAWTARRTFWSAARFSGDTPARYSSMVCGFIATTFSFHRVLIATSVLDGSLPTLERRGEVRASAPFVLRVLRVGTERTRPALQRAASRGDRRGRRFVLHPVH